MKRIRKNNKKKTYSNSQKKKKKHRHLKRRYARFRTGKEFISIHRSQPMVFLRNQYHRRSAVSEPKLATEWAKYKQ